MKKQERTYRILATCVLAPTLIWYITVFFTGTSSPRATLFTVVGITGLFALSAIFFGLGKMTKPALACFTLACTSVLVLFLVAGFLESL